MARPARLAIVVAPAGSGKTTLVAQHAEALGRTAIWYRAGSRDTDPAHLLDGVCRAIRDDEVSPSGRRELLTALAEQPRTLVIDDAHVLVDSAAEDEIERLLTEGPPNLSMILIARRLPGLNLCRAELGEVLVIDSEDLRFRSWEVESLFRDHYDAPLPPDDAAALTRHTQGWAACLRLFHLSTRSRPLPERRRAVAALTGGLRFARAYLARTVLDELPNEMREFLARTAVLETLSGERCDRLLGITESQPALEQLVRLEALTSTDDGGTTFRYHEVLRRHLESALLDELGPGRTRAWYERAARMLEEQGALDEALRAFLRAERWSEVVRLLQQDGHRAISTRPGLYWHELLPPELVDEDPWLSTAVARKLANEGRLTVAAHRYRRAEELFPDAADRERVAHERRLVELWTTGHPQPHLHWLDRLRAVVQNAGKPTSPSARTHPGDRLVVVVAALLTGELLHAGRLADELLEDLELDGHLLLATRLLRTTVDALRGADVSIEAERIGCDAEQLGADWLARQARVLHHAASRDDHQLRHIVAQCSACGDTWGELLAGGARTLRLLLDGKPASESAAALRERTRSAGAGALEAWALGLLALAAAAAGDCATASIASAAEESGRAHGVRALPMVTALARAATQPSDGASQVLSRARLQAEAHGLPWPRTLEARLVGRDAPVSSPAAWPPPVNALVKGSIAVDAPAEMGLRMRCFGGFSIDDPQRTVDWRSLRPRAASALRLLASRAPRPVHRDVLLELWPDLRPARATHSLQVAVSSVRALLAPGAPRGSARMIERVGETYALVLPPGSTLDVMEADAALREADRARREGRTDTEIDALDRALTVYLGELLPEDGPAEWVLAERERWRLRMASACARLADLHLARDDPAAAQAAVDAARRGVEIDPYSDPLWRSLISGYDRTGDAAAAARTRQEYREVLDELGIDSPQDSYARLPVA